MEVLTIKCDTIPFKKKKKKRKRTNKNKPGAGDCILDVVPYSTNAVCCTVQYTVNDFNEPEASF